jgi:hypothetical protein
MIITGLDKFYFIFISGAVLLDIGFCSRNGRRIAGAMLIGHALATLARIFA